MYSCPQLDLAVQIAAGIEAAHDAGIRAYMDLHPMLRDFDTRTWLSNVIGITFVFTYPGKARKISRPEKTVRLSL